MTQQINFLNKYFIIKTQRVKKKSRLRGRARHGHKKKLRVEETAVHKGRWRPFWVASPPGDGLPGSELQAAALRQGPLVLAL